MATPLSDEGLSRAAEAKRERLGEGVARVDRVLFRLGQQGLARLSPATVTELEALVQTAHNAGMVRVERELSALATQVQRYIDRDPLFHMPGYLDALNRVWLLNAEAQRAFDTGADPAELKDALGEARRTYELQAEPLEVQAMGAAGWVTDSDFVGITVYMRCGERVLQVSNARPSAYFGNEPRRLMSMGISEYVDVTIQQLSHGAFRFRNAKLSGDGRLSVHQDLEIEPSPWRGASVYEGCSADSWDALSALLRDSTVHPVSAGGSRLVLVEPASLSVVTVDEKAQLARMDLVDARGAKLEARVPLRPENNQLVDNLETLQRRPELRPPAFFGRASASGGLSFFPMTAVYGTPVRLRGRQEMRVNEVHLTLEDLEKVTL
ncbi:MAG: hypothetical protein H6737_30220 [Alphaproteobacteria bacterium]|nr:hypothetical protein [Alphaproteobacteria bacterium]